MIELEMYHYEMASLWFCDEASTSEMRCNEVVL